MDDNNSTIFVSIASYRDKLCEKTISDLYSKATYPDRIFVGICQQNALTDTDCLSDDLISKYTDNIRIIKLSHLEAKGPTFARYLCSTLYNGEQYFMQIDSHTLFANNWDVDLIDMLNRAKQISAKPVISTYPDNYAAIGNTETVPRICSLRYNSSNILVSDVPQLLAKSKRPTKGVLISGGTFFCDASFLQEVPYDKDLDDLFEGEEILFSARLWTNGWDFFIPDKSLTYHLYTRKDDPKVWNDRKNFNSSKAIEKVKNIMANKKDYGIYGLGNKRSIEDFYKYAGVDDKSHKVNKDFCRDNGKVIEWFNKKSLRSSIPIIILFIFICFVICLKFIFKVKL